MTLRLACTSAWLLAGVLIAGPVSAAEPVRIGVTTILSGPFADRGQSEQYGIELALGRINQAGGVLGRPVEAFYGDNAADVATGVRATQRLIEQEHVPVLIGALWTPVTHAIMPVVQQAKVPLVIDISAGQDFVNASGAGGNDYAFKTIPSDLDIANGMMGWLKAEGAHTVAIVTDDAAFSLTNAASMQTAGVGAGLKVFGIEVIAKGTTDLAPVLGRLKTLAPDRVVTILGASTAAFFKAYEQAGLTLPLTGRIDFATALGAVSPQFLAAGGLASMTGITVFTPALDTPGVQNFVAAYRAKYGLTPTQRSFFAYEAAYVVVDAIRRAGTDTPAAIQQALKTSTMPSLVGGTYAMDDHNHPHTSLQILGLRAGKPAVIAQVGG